MGLRSAPSTGPRPFFPGGKSTGRNRNGPHTRGSRSSHCNSGIWHHHVHWHMAKWHGIKRLVFAIPIVIRPIRIQYLHFPLLPVGKPCPIPIECNSMLEELVCSYPRFNYDTPLEEGFIRVLGLVWAWFAEHTLPSTSERGLCMCLCEMVSRAD